jgi:hypothetical protein
MAFGAHQISGVSITQFLQNKLNETTLLIFIRQGGLHMVEVLSDARKTKHSENGIT